MKDLNQLVNEAIQAKAETEEILAMLGAENLAQASLMVEMYKRSSQELDALKVQLVEAKAHEEMSEHARLMRIANEHLSQTEVDGIACESSEFIKKFLVLRGIKCELVQYQTPRYLQEYLNEMNK